MRRVLLGALAALVLVAPAGAEPESDASEQASPPQQTPQTPPNEQRPAPLPPEEPSADPRRAETPPILYIPPPRGATKVRVGAATRGERLDVPTLDALAPDHVAYTTHAAPVLCWYLSESTETRIDIALRDEQSVEPLLELTVPRDTSPGVHELRLAEQDMTLQEGRVYLWFVSLVPDAESRSNDVIASGAIQRIAASPELVRELAGSPPRDAWRVYASHGIWYDALAELTDRIERNPGDRALRDARMRLLQQVELPRAAAYDRAARGG